jgi:hypothetical protein
VYWMLNLGLLEENPAFEGGIQTRRRNSTNASHLISSCILSCPSP